LKNVKPSKTAAGADFQWTAVTIGGSLDALRFATKNKTHLLLNSYPAIHSYDVDSAGNNLEEQWSALSVELYEKGLNPFGGLIQSLRFELDSDTIKVFTLSGNMYRVKYQTCTIFSMQDIAGLDSDFNQVLLGYRVLDWFDIKRHSKIDLTSIEANGEEFAKKIQLFQSSRRDGEHASKDLVVESFMTRQQISSIEYSDTMSRFKAQALLSSHGFPGVELELWKRDVLPIYKQDYKKSNNITLVKVG